MIELTTQYGNSLLLNIKHIISVTDYPSGVVINVRGEEYPIKVQESFNQIKVAIESE